MSNGLNSKRIGRFRIQLDLIRYHFNDIKPVLNGCFIVRAERLWSPDCLEYTAINEKFDEISDAEIPPEYNLLCTVHDGGMTSRWITTEWQKVK